MLVVEVFVRELREVVGPCDSRVADIPVCSHAFGHVRFAVVVECFVELPRCALDVAEMDKIDFPLLTKMTDDIRQVIGLDRSCPGTGRCRWLTRDEIEQFLVIVDTAHDAGDSLDRG